MKTSDFLSKLESALQNELPGMRAHEEMSPLHRPLDSRLITDYDRYRKSAVSVILYEEANTLHFVLIQRPVYEGTHGGQISFPGGKLEETDSDLEHTARRETQEEIGIQLTKNQLLGSLSTVFIPVSQFIVQPFVYFLEEKPIFIPDQREVAEIIHPPLIHLLDSASKQTKSMDVASGVRMKNVPYFQLSNKTVWGATALILNELKWLLKEGE